MLTKEFKAIRFKLYRTFEDQAANLIAPVLPRDYLEKRIRPPLIVPYYHLVSDERVEHVINLYSYRNTAQFQADLDFFLKNYHPIGLAELLEAVKTGNRLKEKSFLITFDDGFREAHDIVAPILKQKGVPAVFFITTAFLDNQTLGYRHKASLLVERFDQRSHAAHITNKVAEILGCVGGTRSGVKKGLLSHEKMDREKLDAVASLLEVNFESYLFDRQPYLTTTQVRALIQDGFHIGAHSIDHFPYKSLTQAEQFTQTSQSTALIKQKFGLDYALFAFPYSDSGARAPLFEALNGRIDLYFGTSAFCRDPIKNMVHRFWMENTRYQAGAILNRIYVRNQIRQVFGLNKKSRQTR